MTTNLSKKPVRADLLSARRMLKGRIAYYTEVGDLSSRIEYHKGVGDPFDATATKAALWAVNYVLKHRTEEEES